VKAKRSAIFNNIDEDGLTISFVDIDWAHYRAIAPGSYTKKNTAKLTGGTIEILLEPGPGALVDVGSSPLWAPSGMCPRDLYGSSKVDPILQAMLASEHGVSLTSLLPHVPALPWVSRDMLRFL